MLKRGMRWGGTGGTGSRAVLVVLALVIGAGGALCDGAPTLLRMMGIDPPAEMTGRDLRQT